MKQFNPFPTVHSPYGAPMGRPSDAPGLLHACRRLHARRQGGGDGYDKGGAYWGTPSNVWGVWGRTPTGVVCVYVRAWSRDSAIRNALEA